MRLAISTGFSYTRDYREILDIIVEAGAKNVELCLNQSLIDVPLEEIKKAIDARGLRVTSIHTPIFFIREARGESEAYWINKAIQYARQLGAEVIVSHSVLSGAGEHIKNVDHVYKKNLIRYKDGKDYVLCTENMCQLPVDSFISNPDTFTSYVTREAYPITFDTTHWLSHGRELIDGYERLRPYIMNIHLSDYLEGRQHVVLGESGHRIGEFLQHLMKDGYEGLITLELDFDNKKRNHVEGIDQAISLMKKCMAYIYEKIA